ncbi:MAG: O-antigen ligase family protein, partial [Candidatus Latescibacterota bacterium]|nr:O-antigen ligase family protein [Candidatus Latescibacterota bacterium]
MSREVTTAPRSPDSGLMISVTFLLIIVPLVYSHFVFDSGLLPKFLGMMVGALPVAACWAKMEFRGEAVRTGLLTDLPIFLYTLIVVLQWPRALDVHQASLEVVKVLTFVIIYMAITRCSVEAHWQLWATTFVLVTFVVSLVGIAQYFGLAFLSLPSSGLPSSTFVYRNTVAMFLITALPFSFLKFAQADVGRREIFWAFSWTTICTFLIYTRTRGAWVGCLGSLIVVLVLIGVRYRLTTLSPRRVLKVFRSRKAVVLFCSLVVLASVGTIDPSNVTTTGTQAIPIPEEKDSVRKALDSVVSSVVMPANTISRGRVWWWRSTFEMITDHPWIGVGLTNWEKIYPNYKAKELWAATNRFPRRPHNDYLWVWAELGTLGFTAYLGMFTFLAYAAVSSARSLNLKSYGLVVAALAGVVAIQGHSLFSFPKERVGPMLGE